eukprot:6757883-Pyramimonas_sp.AAC.1
MSGDNREPAYLTSGPAGMPLHVGPSGSADRSFGDGVAHDGPHRCLVWVAAPGGFVHPLSIVLAVPLLVDVGNDYAMQNESGGLDGIQGGGCEVDAIPEGNLM